jgi:uncharacterized protein with von Willebrand factor type A (vWA) domain
MSEPRPGGYEGRKDKSMKQYGIYEIITDKIGREMVDNYKRIKVKFELASGENKAFYQKILDDLNADFKQRFNFDWGNDGY